MRHPYPSHQWIGIAIDPLNNGSQHNTLKDFGKVAVLEKDLDSTVEPTSLASSLISLAMALLNTR
jgi:hypothetical protein